MNWFKAVIGASAFLAGSGVFYYFVFYVEAFIANRSR